MKSFLKLFFLLFIPFALGAQENPFWENPPKGSISNLRNQVSHEQNDSIRMYLCRQLGIYYHEVNIDSSHFFLEIEMSIAKKLNLKLWVADAGSRIGYVYSLMANYSKSLSVLNDALELANDESIEKNSWQVSRITKTGDPHIARLTVVASTLHNFGHLYGWTHNREKQFSKYLETLAVAEKIKDYALLSLVYMNIGNVYEKMDQLNLALKNEQKALNYVDTSRFTKYKGLILSRIGDIYIKLGKNDIAKKYLLESIKTNEEESIISFLAEGCVSFSKLLFSTGDLDSSFYYANKGLNASLESGYPDEMLRAYIVISSIYKAWSNLDSAFKYQSLALTVKDSLYTIEKNNQFQNMGFDEQVRLQELEKGKIKTQNRIRTFALLIGLGVFLLIGIILYRNNRQKQKANKVLETTLTNLKSTQSQLIQFEKMASLGELTAGIAHEIQNPLNFVNNFSEVNRELIEELVEEVDKGNTAEVKSIAKDIKDNEEKINHHGKRADAIVKGMLQHSRTSSGLKESTNINALADEYLRLAYHGLRAKDKSFNATMKTDYDETIGNINIIPQDIGRVILNLITNAFYVVDEKKKQNPTGYEPTVTVSTKLIVPPPGGTRGAEISVKDNGNGIPQKLLDKIFQPFFTTKPTGQGTGLGLSLSYDIVKAHGGELKVETKEARPDDPVGRGEGSTFIIKIPIV